MTYRSQILIVLSNAACEQMTDAVKSAFQTCFGDVTIRLPEGDSLFTNDYRSWDDIGDDDVICIMEYLKELDDGLFLYQRAGEDRSDFEELGEFRDNPFEASIETKIVFNKLQQPCTPMGASEEGDNYDESIDD